MVTNKKEKGGRRKEKERSFGAVILNDSEESHSAGAVILTIP